MTKFFSRRLLATAICLTAIFSAVGTSSAATPARACAPPAFTGSVKAQAAAYRCSNARAKRGKRGARGLRGSRGARGRSGAIGATGAVGVQGFAGATGSQGVNGLQGIPGIDASDGVAGPAGPAGIQGNLGPVGPSGASGAAGVTGSTGAVGPAGTTLSEYAYIYNLTGTVIPIGAEIPFDSNGLITAGIIHAPGSSTVELVNPGVYKLTFSVSGSEANQMAVLQNGVLIPGTIYGSGAGTQQNTGQVLFSAMAGDVIQIENHMSAAAVTLATPIGGTESSVNASITIEKIG